MFEYVKKKWYTNLIMKNRNNFPIHNVDLVYTTYTLLLYLLYQSKEEIASTAFFCGFGLPQAVIDKLPNSIDCQRYYCGTFNNNPIQYLYFYHQLKQLRREFPFLKHSKYYGADHLRYHSAIIGYNKMCVIGDGLGLYYPSKFEEPSLWGKILQSIFGIITKPHGRGKHCDSILYTGMLPLSLPDKKLIKINPAQLWNEDVEKQRMILNLFDLNQQDLEMFKGKDIIIFTQHLELIMSMENKIKIYQDVISQFDNKKIIIKTHPLEDTDYGFYFPNVACFTKPLPMELITFMGIIPKIVVTYNSAAVFNFGDETKKIILDEKFKR